jgi:hypothetical protein
MLAIELSMVGWRFRCRAQLYRANHYARKFRQCRSKLNEQIHLWFLCYYYYSTTITTCTITISTITTSINYFYYYFTVLLLLLLLSLLLPLLNLSISIKINYCEMKVCHLWIVQISQRYERIIYVLYFFYTIILYLLFIPYLHMLTYTLRVAYMIMYYVRVINYCCFHFSPKYHLSSTWIKISLEWVPNCIAMF